MTVQEEVIMTREAIREQWAERVRAQRASGKSMSVFCREHGIEVRKFWWWSRKLSGESVGRPAVQRAEPLRFARVEIVRPSETLAVSVRLPAGVVIESSGGYPDPLWIRAVISGLVEEGLRCEPSIHS